MIEILEKNKCSGCRACEQACTRNCILKFQDSEGFRYPKVEIEACIECGLCEKVCPFISSKEPLNGKPLFSYAAYNRDEAIRDSSSSGGIFTLLAEYTLNIKKGVVFGATYDDKWNVIHSFTDDLNLISKFRGSKYVQSDTLDTFRQVKEYLKQDKFVLYSGTPCQISGLKKFLSKNYDNLLTMDFICHGVPSGKVWKHYLNNFFCSNNNCTISDIKDISFRNKNNGWKNFTFKIDINTSTGVKTICEPYFTNSYMKGFLKDLYLRPSCYSCKCKCSWSISDITLGDFWGIEKIMPDFDDDKGCSVVLLNSEKGKFVFNLVSNKIMIRDVDYDDVVQNNPALINSVAIQSNKRQHFFDNYENRPFNLLVNKLEAISISQRVYSKLKMIYRRILK